MPILSVPCIIIKTTIHVKSSENNMDKSKKIIWKNGRNERCGTRWYAISSKQQCSQHCYNDTTLNLRELITCWKVDGQDDISWKRGQFVKLTASSLTRAQERLSKDHIATRLQTPRTPSLSWAPGGGITCKPWVWKRRALVLAGRKTCFELFQH